MEAKTFNKVEIQGFLGKDATIKSFENGRTLINLSVATSESYKNMNGEWVNNTTWHNVACWKSKEDKIEEFLKKGMLVTVSGKIKTRKYTGKDGQDKYITEIVAQKLEQVA